MERRGHHVSGTDWSDRASVYRSWPTRGRRQPDRRPGVLTGDLAEDITYGGSLVIPGIKAVAQVEIYDSNGDGIAIERGDNVSNGKVLVKTKYADNETIIYFGDLDVTHGGRIRFAARERGFKPPV